MHAYMVAAGCDQPAVLQTSGSGLEALSCDLNGYRLTAARVEEGFDLASVMDIELMAQTGLYATSYCLPALLGGSWFVNVLVDASALGAVDHVLLDLVDQLGADVLTSCGSTELGTGATELMGAAHWGVFHGTCTAVPVEYPWLTEPGLGAACVGIDAGCATTPADPVPAPETDGPELVAALDADAGRNCDLEVTLIPLTVPGSAEIRSWAAGLGTCQRAVVTDNWAAIQSTSTIDASSLAELPVEYMAGQLEAEAIIEGCG
jgi:hypothetical protein